MLDFRGFLLSEVQAHVLSQNPEFVIAYKGNVWVVGSDSDPSLISRIGQIIQANHAQGANLPAPTVQNVTQLIVWLQNLGDVIVAKYNARTGSLSTHSSGRFQNRNLSPTNPLVPKMVKALQAAGLNVQTNFSTAPGQRQPETGTTPKTVYHGTSTVSLGGMLRYGLNPGGQGKSNWGVHHEDKVFVSAVFEEAQRHADNAALKKKYDDKLKYDPFWRSAPILPTVIAFKVPDPDAIAADYDVAQGAMKDPMRDSNPYEAFDNKQIYFGQDAGRASQYAGSFAVLGRIGPQHIISVHLKDSNSWREATPQELEMFKNQHRSETGRSEMPNKFLYDRKPRQQQEPAMAMPANAGGWDVMGDDEDFGAGLTMGDPPEAIPMEQPPQVPAQGGFMNWLKRFNKSSAR